MKADINGQADINGCHSKNRAVAHHVDAVEDLVAQVGGDAHVGGPGARVE